VGAPLPVGRGDDVDVQVETTTLRTAGRQGARRSPGGQGGRRGGGGCGGGLHEEYGDQEPRRPGQVGEEAARVPGADGDGPVVWQRGEGIGGSVDGGFREAGGGGESRGAEDGGRCGRRRSGRMTAAAVEDTTTTMAAYRGRKSG
jgi:hypothetical protein